MLMRLTAWQTGGAIDCLADGWWVFAGRGPGAGEDPNDAAKLLNNAGTG